MLPGQDTARLEGKVLDPTGAAVPNAKVTVTSTATARETEATSDAQAGTFAIPGLAVGEYTIAVEAPGFQKYVQNVRLDPGQIANAQITLAPGQVTQTVVVSDQAALVDSASSDLRSTINSQQVSDLPLNGRNFTQLATLSPGVSRGVPTSAATGSGGNAETFRNGGVGGAALAVNGLRPQANNFILDGADNNESLVNSIVFFPPAEAIQEFSVTTSVAPAEFGRAGGAIINTSLKSGTNEVHGSAFDFLRNSALDARQTFAATKTLFQRNQFGGTLGLPVIKNKFFWFGDYQGLRQNQPLSPSQVTVPTTAMRAGDFSALLDPAASGLGQAYVIRNVATGVPYLGNVIPSTQISAVGAKYLNAFPLPNIPGKVQQNYLTSEAQTQTFDDFDVRGDYIFGQNDTLFGRFSFGRDLSNTSSEFPNLPAGFGTGSSFNESRGFVLGETHIFSPTLVNELRLAWQREFLGYMPPFANTPVSENLGIPNANRSPLLGGGALIGGNGGQLEYTGDYGTYAVPENTYQIKDGLTKTLGKHILKGGFDLIWRQVNYFRPLAGKGFYSLFNNGGAGSTGYDVSDILSGFISNYQIGAQSGYYGTRSWEDGFYFQDDWKLNPRLTLNLGLRYDILTWPTEQFNRQSDFDLANGTVLLAGQNGNRASLIAQDHNNFAPRVGFAYQASNDGKTVIRGGYGMFYFIDRGGISNQLGQNPPFAGVSTYDYTNGYRFTISGQAPMNSNDPTAANPSAMPAPGFPNFNPNAPLNQSYVAALLNNVNSYVHEYNLQIQREVFKDAVFSIGYVGDIGKKLTFYYDANQQFFNAPVGAKAYPNLGSITTQATRGNSNYNSLQTQFEKRMTNGLQYRASFTWSKNISDGDGAFDGAQPQDIRNFAVERGLASIHQKYLFVSDLLYQLPFGRGKKFGSHWVRPVDIIVGGWQLNGIWTWQSGLPFNITDSSNYFGNERPNVVGPATIYGNPNRFFDTTAFAAPPQVLDASGNGTGVFISPGNLGRNVLTGPSYLNLDVSVFKDFSITERLKFQFRGEFYNIANHERWGQPDSNLTDANFGRITSTLLSSERQIELAARFYF
ncbi:MAG: TonB-dependent receptor [Acidobacteriota bacterium]|nr:TonB-dependent receptor [Acidobacteriota bacterium]